MKKNIKIITALAVIGLAAVVLLNQGNRNTLNSKFDNLINIPSSKKLNINKYDMDIKIDDSNRILHGTEKVTYFNRSSKTMSNIYFHIYPNAFNDKDITPVMFNDTEYAYPKGFKPCYIEIQSISINDKKVDYSIYGGDKTTLKLNLKNPLKKNQKAQIKIDFLLKIPEARDRISYFDGLYHFGNWYPIAAVYDNSGWNLDPFYDIGDPFYSEIADYSVKITLPDKYIVASTGNITNEEIKDGWRVVSINAKSVRDFAWAASSKFKVYNSEVEGIKIKYYFTNSNSERINKAISTGVEAIKVFNEHFGKYPYESYSIVESHFPTGMEYPGLIFIPNGYFGNSKSELGLEGVIVHETAHQWWYGAVGNNEIDEAWLDEGLATYSKVIYFEKLKGDSFGLDYYKKNIASAYESKRKSIKGKEIVLKPLNAFDGWREYDTLAYKKGAVIFNAIREEIGDDEFFGFLKAYYKTYMFKNASTDDLIQSVETSTNKDWDAFFDKWLLGEE